MGAAGAAGSGMGGSSPGVGGSSGSVGSLAGASSGGSSGCSGSTVKKGGGADSNVIDTDRATTGAIVQYNYVHDTRFRR
ncbi:MAG: hypothetical protein ABIQ16_27510 [Polyangiaceae bacterium]